MILNDLMLYVNELQLVFTLRSRYYNGIEKSVNMNDSFSTI